MLKFLIFPEAARFDDSLLSINTVEDRASFQRFIKEAKRGNPLITADSGNQFKVAQTLALLMSEERIIGHGINLTQNYYSNNGGSMVVGDNNRVVSLDLSQNQKKEIQELQQIVAEMLLIVQEYDGDFKQKSNAFQELSGIDSKLSKIDVITVEEKSKLLQALDNIKSGTSGAVELIKKIKSYESNLSWLLDKASSVSDFLNNF